LAEVVSTLMQLSNEPLEQEVLVSVIVPCYNSERTIRQCLTALVNQRTYVPFDIIVVDSSSDRTGEIVAREFPSVKLIRLGQRTFAGAARNIGVRATRAKYCLMMDSDCIAAPDLIDRIVARHSSGDYSAVGGALRNGTGWSLSGWVGYLIEFKEFAPSAPMRLAMSVPTANVAYRRDVLEHFGYFDDDMWLAEDILFNWKLYKAGKRILFDPAIEVVHINRTGWREVFSYQVNLGRLSAIARARGGLPGCFFLKHPGFIVLLPFARLLRALWWFISRDRKLLPIFLLVWPMYLAAAVFWSYGFLRGAIKVNKSLITKLC
jgi:glycosyltransferase involved in cell wall biosynthesis